MATAHRLDIFGPGEINRGRVITKRRDRRLARALFKLVPRGLSCLRIPAEPAARTAQECAPPSAPSDQSLPIYRPRRSSPKPDRTHPARRVAPHRTAPSAHATSCLYSHRRLRFSAPAAGFDARLPLPPAGAINRVHASIKGISDGSTSHATCTCRITSNAAPSQTGAPTSCISPHTRDAIA